MESLSNQLKAILWPLVFKYQRRLQNLLHRRGCITAAYDSLSHGQRGRCPSREAKSCAKLLAGCIAFCDSDSCAKLLADGVAKSCAKLSKQISRNHRPTRLMRLTRPTSLSASREAQYIHNLPNRHFCCRPDSYFRWPYVAPFFGFLLNSRSHPATGK